jgi:hypothetical protein
MHGKEKYIYSRKKCVNFTVQDTKKGSAFLAVLFNFLLTFLYQFLIGNLPPPPPFIPLAVSPSQTVITRYSNFQI